MGKEINKKKPKRTENEISTKDFMIETYKDGIIFGVKITLTQCAKDQGLPFPEEKFQAYKREIEKLLV